MKRRYKAIINEEFTITLIGKSFADVETNLKALNIIDRVISIELDEDAEELKTPLQTLMNEWSNWTNSEFYDGQIKKEILEQIRLKMLEEYKEVVKAENNYFKTWDINTLTMELSDCFGLFLDYASKLNLTAEDLIKSTDAKLQINLGRNWSKQANGTFKHK